MNTFGGSLSGAVIIPHLYNGHDKTFFFIDTEENRHPGSQLVIDNVPTRGYASGQSQRPAGSCHCEPIYRRTISQSQSNPGEYAQSGGGEALLDVWASRCPTSTPVQPRVTIGRCCPWQNETNGYDLRFDQYIKSKNLLFGRWTWKNLPQQTLSGGGGSSTAQLTPPITNNETGQAT